jgi:hypothetical protein
MFENAPRWELRHVLCDCEVCVDLKECLGDGGAGVAGGHHPLQAWIIVKERSERLGTQRERITVGGYVPDGV